MFHSLIEGQPCPSMHGRGTWGMVHFITCSHVAWYVLRVYITKIALIMLWCSSMWNCIRRHQSIWLKRRQGVSIHYFMQAAWYSENYPIYSSLAARPSHYCTGEEEKFSCPCTIYEKLGLPARLTLHMLQQWSPYIYHTDGAWGNNRSVNKLSSIQLMAYVVLIAMWTRY